MAELDPGCEKTISGQILRNIDSHQRLQAQQCIATTRRSVPLLREGLFSDRFYTAWTQCGNCHHILNGNFRRRKGIFDEPQYSSNGRTSSLNRSISSVV
jgi:hypothetical protein